MYSEQNHRLIQAQAKWLQTSSPEWPPGVTMKSPHPGQGPPPQHWPSLNLHSLEGSCAPVSCGNMSCYSLRFRECVRASRKPLCIEPQCPQSFRERNVGMHSSTVSSLVPLRPLHHNLGSFLKTRAYSILIQVWDGTTGSAISQVAQVRRVCGQRWKLAWF